MTAHYSKMWTKILSCVFLLLYIINYGTAQNTTEETPGGTITGDAVTPIVESTTSGYEGPSRAEIRWLTIVDELMAQKSQSFNDTFFQTIETYPFETSWVIEDTYFNSDYMLNTTTRPDLTTLSSDELLQILSVVIDVLDDSSVNITTREVLVTTAFMQDLTATILLEMSENELTADFGEFESVMSYIIEICDILLDEEYVDLWLDIQRAYPVYAAVIETVDVASLAIANLIESPGTLKSDVKNINFFLVKDSWYNLTQTYQDYVFQVSDNEGILIPELYLEQAEFDYYDEVALVSVQYKGVSDFMGKNKTRVSVSTTIREQSSYNPRILNNDVISMTAIRVPDFSSTSIPVIYRMSHIEKKLEHWDVICAFWNFDKFSDEGGVWDDTGCEVIEVSSSAWSTQCFCNHTTNFGLILLEHDPEYVDWHFIIQTWLWSIAAGVSVLPLFPFFGFLIYLTTINSKRRSAQINFVFSLIMMLLVLATNEVAKWQKSDYACMGFGIAMHLFTTSTFAWLFVISILLFTRVTEFTSKEAPHWLAFLIGWGTPILTVGVTGSLLYTEYGIGPRCWFNNNSKIKMALMVPTLVYSVLTILLLLASIRAIVQAGKITLFEREKEELLKLRATCLCFLALSPELSIFYFCGHFSFINPMIGYVFGGLMPFQGLLVVLLEKHFNKELEEAYKIKKNPPEELKDEYDIWAAELDDAVRGDPSLAQEEEYFSSGRKSKASVLSMRGIKLAKAVRNAKPQMVGGTATKTTGNKKKKKKKKKANETPTEVLKETAVREQADGESRGRNSTEPPPPSMPPSKPKIGFMKTDYSELDEQSPYRTKQTASEIAATLPRSATSRTPAGRTTPGRRTPSGKKSPRKTPTPRKSPIPRSPSLPGAPDDPEEDFGALLAPPPRKKGDGSSPIGDRKSPEGAVVNDAYEYDDEYYDENGEYYDDEYYDDYGEYDENGEYYDDEYYEDGEYDDYGEYEEEY
ncbi:uncharacterized protein LOC121407425 [Lytechinus variegatus]|uniref:uncharacterized protein LOC121407425 n=1 Tax=Lytechinus variegatus TaxID=7654 RepID=UPI001BB0F155|nr:uncharacterized protein LOC121407425 [Lytechinus variegatus]